jgi:hypothetical protein
MDALSVTLLLFLVALAGTTWFAVRAHAGRRALAASEDALAETRRELASVLAELTSLSGLVPMCAWCKKILDDAGYWQQVEGYLSSRTDAQFSHAACPECFDRMQADMPDARWRI